MGYRRSGSSIVISLVIVFLIVLGALSVLSSFFPGEGDGSFSSSDPRQPLTVTYNGESVSGDELYALGTGASTFTVNRMENEYSFSIHASSDSSYSVGDISYIFSQSLGNVTDRFNIGQSGSVITIDFSYGEPLTFFRLQGWLNYIYGQTVTFAEEDFPVTSPLFTVIVISGNESVSIKVNPCVLTPIESITLPGEVIL